MTLDDAETEVLLDPAAAGDEIALRRLFERYRGRLGRMVGVRIDSRLAARIDASDIVQEALADANRKLRDYARERPLPFYPWLRQLAAERLAHAHRHHLRVAGRTVHRERPGDLGPQDGSHALLIDRLAASDTSPTASYRREEDRQRVRSALDALSAVDREVLVLRHLEDLPFHEVAAVLGITENAAKVRHFRALERVRKLMDEESQG